MKAARKRVLRWQPTWTREIEGWTAVQIRKNLWRFDPIDSFEDILQEAKLLFFTLDKKYPIVRDAAHFFTLYKTSLHRQFIDKGWKRTESAVMCSDEMPESLQITGIPNYGFMNLLVDELPDELKVVLAHLTTGRVRLKVDRPASKPRVRENHNMRLKKQLSLTLVDPVGDLKRLLQP